VHTKVEPVYSPHLSTLAALQSLVQELASVMSENFLPFMDALASYLRLNIESLRNQQGSLETVDLKGLPTALLTTTPALEPRSIHKNMRQFCVLFTEESWKRSLYIHGCGLQYNHEHAMTGPIVGHGQLIGMVHFARKVYPAFDAKDLASQCPVYSIGAKSAVTCSLKATYQNGTRLTEA